MRLHELVASSDRVAGVSARLEKIDLLASLLRRLAPDEIEFAIAFLSGSPRQGRLGVGWSVISDAKSVAPAGDPQLELRDVDETFERIARASGSGSTAEKIRLLRELLGRAIRDEQDFLVRLLFGELRQGAQEGIVLEAVARAAWLASGKIRRAAMLAGDLGPVARAALLEGENGLSRFAIRVLQPVQPMLAQSAGDTEEAMKRLGEAALEYKLDGARVQVHKAGDEVRVFSRTLKEVTPAVPEIVEITRTLAARELILDGEVIALRPDETPYPFQTTMRRFGRKLDVDRLRAELPLTPFFFDCLYFDGESLIDEAQARRFGVLTDQTPGKFVIPRLVTATVQEAGAFLDDAIRQGHEGIMAKARDATYDAGSRGQTWLKVKPAHTLDLVVLGAEWGHGRRRGWLSNLHLGARDPERNDFVMLGKTFKGLTDEMLAWQTQKFLERELGRDDFTVYVRPELVVEIAFNDVQESPQYVGGLALRFARVKRFRPDKTAADSDTFQTIQQMFRRTTGKEPPARR